MNAESVKSFITYYLQSLTERTRREKSGAKWGIDWVAYNLGLARFGKPFRLPFIRSGELGFPQSKSEAEFGIDISFLSDGGDQLTIFVLKDEPLTNSTWTKSDFDRDLRMAIAPDLNAEGLHNVSLVTIILAYNKDDQQNGIEAYNRWVAAAPSKVGDKVALRFVRWNLSELVNQTILHVLSPSLLPERFFGQLSYLSAQFADFRHGSEAWQTQLIPNWNRFIDDVLQESAGLRGPALAPVALIILRQRAAPNPSFETGWIELVEWTAVALWRRHAEHPNPAATVGIQRFWRDFYIAELDRFYRAHISDLSIEHAIDSGVAMGSYLGAVAASYTSYWHIGRLGLLSVELAESSGSRMVPEQSMNEIADWTALLTSANVSVLRPVLDIQHIEFFLMAAIWRNAGRLGDLALIIEHLVSRLYPRRLGRSSLPFIDGGNSIANVFEQVATQPDPPIVLAQSSFFVLMLLELCCILPDEARDKLLALVHRRLVLGAFDQGDPGDTRPLDLVSWIPPDDWSTQVFNAEMPEGQGVGVGAFASHREASSTEILAGVRALVAEMRKVGSRFRQPTDVPIAASILTRLRLRPTRCMFAGRGERG
jgi:hypothetical protein